GLVERTRQRMRRSGRVVNGPNRYRLILVSLEQAKAAAAHATQRLKEALARRKLRLSSNCQNDSELYFQRDIFFEKPRSKNDWLDLIASWSPSPSTS
ncbi:helix-turn-helix domain-containing protein, partial [Gluconobacter sp. AC10]|nr:helix-turn-helix domain-containing protein [Gluconobacter aidae]